MIYLVLSQYFDPAAALNEANYQIMLETIFINSSSLSPLPPSLPLPPPHTKNSEFGCLWRTLCEHPFPKNLAMDLLMKQYITDYYLKMYPFSNVIYIIRPEY